MKRRLTARDNAYRLRSGPARDVSAILDSLVSTIFGLTYLALALGKVPGLRIDRAGIALVGAAAMLACGVLSMREAAEAVDYETIVLLFGMMVVVAYLRLAGFFALATEWIAGRFSGPFSLLAVTIALSGVLSAFLVNDVVCVALTPLVLHLCQRSRRPPIPYLVGLATASNVGSVATITGNPQNIIIGSLSQISYLRFAARLAPVAVDRACRSTSPSWRWSIARRWREPGKRDRLADSGRRRRDPSPAADQERRGHTGHGRALLRRAADRARGPGGGGRPDARSRPAREGLPARSTGRCWSCSPGCSSWFTPSRSTSSRPGAWSAGTRCWIRRWCWSAGFRCCCRTWCRTCRRCCCSSRSWR